MDGSQNRGSSSSEVHHHNGESVLARLRAFSQQPTITTLTEVLGKQSALHLVGGAVRDTLLDAGECDIDLATLLTPEEVAAALERQGIRVVPTGLEHGTITAVIHGANIEITTFRVAGPRTVNAYSRTIEEDLSGRDFTINAIAYDLFAHKLVDPYGGIDDIKNRILKAVGDARVRFEEDPHRIMRMVRFGSAEGRTVDTATWSAAEAQASALSRVSIERIRSEFEKILMAHQPHLGIDALYQLGIIHQILPELLPSVGFEQNDFHTEDVYRHTLTVVSRAERELSVRLAALFHDIGKPASSSVGEDGRRHFYMHEEIGADIGEHVMQRMKFSHDQVSDVKKLVQYHMRPLECGPAAVRRLLRDLGSLFPQWRAIKIADAPPTVAQPVFEEALKKFDAMVIEERSRVVGSPYQRLAISGEDLKALGMKEGPAIGAVLKNLLDCIIEVPEDNTKERLLELAKQYINA
jgi:tRNA nucleotidyltransferase (CCA-adding enzyme)